MREWPSPDFYPANSAGCLEGPTFAQAGERSFELCFGPDDKWCGIGSQTQVIADIDSPEISGVLQGLSRCLPQFANPVPRSNLQIISKAAQRTTVMSTFIVCFRN